MTGWGVFFFCGEDDAGDYSILPIYRACRDARRRVETGVSPTPKGGCGGHPPHIRAYTRNRFFAYQPQVARRREPPPMPFAHCRFILRVSSLIRALRARCAREKSLPAIFSRLAYRKIYCAHPHRTCTRKRTFAYHCYSRQRRELNMSSGFSLVVFALKNQLPASSAELMPQPRGADAGEQRSPHPVDG